MQRPTDLILQHAQQFRTETLHDFFWRIQDWLKLRGLITDNNTGLNQEFGLNSFISSTQDSDFLHCEILFDRTIPSKKHEFGPAQIVGTLNKYLLLVSKKMYTKPSILPLTSTVVGKGGAMLFALLTYTASN